MIELNVDFSLLHKYFGISISSISKYANKDIEEIMELEAANGNEKAKQYEKILSNPDKLLEIFKLANVENKYIILQNMSEGDLDKLLPYLTSEQLAMGLNFFTNEKLMTLVNELPKEELVAMVFEKFSLPDVLNLMQDDSMNNFLMEPDVERKYAQKYFESLNYEALQKIMIEQFGIEFQDKSREEYLEKLNSMDDKSFSKFMTSLQREEKMNLINGIVAQKPDLLLLFESSDLTHPMEFLMKEDKIKMMEKLDAEFLAPMIQELPADLTQVVLTQIDPVVFSEILARDFQDILASVVLFAPSY